jgi:hypothetical protein
MSRKDFEPFISQWLSDPSSVEGKKVRNHGNSQLFVEGGKLWSYGYHYLLGKRGEGRVMFVNDATHSMTTTTQQNILRRQAHNRRYQVIPFIRTADVDGVLRYMDRRVRGFLLSRLRVHGGNIIPAAQSMILGRKNPMAILTDVFDSDSIHFCISNSNQPDLFSLVESYLQRDRSGGTLCDLRDVLDTIKYPDYQPLYESGRVMKFLMGKSKNIKGRRVPKCITQYVNDIEMYGPEVAAMNLATEDNGLTIQAALNA